MSERFDVVVVGAGPAGAAAALSAVRGGASVLLVERGPYPGAKNLYGGVIYGRVMDDLVPGWAERAPLERFVTRRVTMMLSREDSVAFEVRSPGWGRPPYNGATATRASFDSWLASEAVAAGARLVTSTTVTSLAKTGSRVSGVRTDRPDGDVAAGVVVLCEGVNALLAREIGLAPAPGAHGYALGVKETLRLDANEIERRFALNGREGADIEVVGATGSVAGGGFLYTNHDSLAVGLVLSLDGLTESGQRPDELLSSFKAHPAIAPLVHGGEIVEYGAHLVSEAGPDCAGRRTADGAVVAGDAGGFCLSAGLFLEGVNFAIGSGAAAGEAAAEAVRVGDTSAHGLAGYEDRLASGFLLADHRRLSEAAGFFLSPRMQRSYPSFASGLARDFFTVRNPLPKEGLRRLAQAQMRSSGLRLRDLARDGRRLWRIFG